MQLERQYFESGHGTSAADALSAVIKYGATKAVTNQQAIIRNAQEFFQFCETKLQQVGVGPFPQQMLIATAISFLKLAFKKYNDDLAWQICL